MNLRGFLHECYRPRALRHERKFRAAGLPVPHALAAVRLHPWGFKPAYPDRRVNNLYLDTPGLDCLRDNLAGQGEREKFRLRWYGDEEAAVVRPTLEIKFKSGLLNGKQSWTTGDLVLAPGPEPADVDACLDGTQAPPGVLSLLRGLRMTLLNSYLRSYYISRDGRFRLTVDRDLEFRQVYPGRRPSARGLREHGTVIVELKYSPEDRDRAERFHLGFPLRLTRSSKYATGLSHFMMAA